MTLDKLIEALKKVNESFKGSDVDAIYSHNRTINICEGPKISPLIVDIVLRGENFGPKVNVTIINDFICWEEEK